MLASGFGDFKLIYKDGQAPTPLASHPVGAVPGRFGATASPTPPQTLRGLLDTFPVTFTAALVPLTDDERFNPLTSDKQKWQADITLNIDPPRYAVSIFFLPASNVAKPFSGQYHPRYNADVSSLNPAPTVGQFMPESWWEQHGAPIVPTIYTLGTHIAEFGFLMQDIATFEDYCLATGLNNDSLRVYRQYQSDLDRFAALKTFFGEYFDAFVNAIVDL